MATRDELRAAERLLHVFHEDECSPLAEPEDDDSIRDDVITVAEAIRAANPADDDEDIDGDFLIGIGAKGGHDADETDAYSITICDGIKILFLLRWKQGEIVSSSMQLIWRYQLPTFAVTMPLTICDDPTRGDVRRLLAALKIDPKPETV